MTDYAPAGLLRRLAAAVYDVLVVAALFMLTAFVVLAFRGGKPVNPGNLLFQFSLVATAAIYYAGFWAHGGQTIGMRAWRIKVEQQTGEALSWQLGLIRFVIGVLCMIPAGLGMLWLIVDPQHLTWYDRLTRTRVVVLPKTGKQPPAAR